MRARKVRIGEQEVFKIFPKQPPQRGDIVLVDGERCRVTRAKVTWDGLWWTLRLLKVKRAP